MTTFRMNQSDLEPILAVTLQNEDGTTPNLAGATVEFKLSKDGVQIFKRAAAIIEPSAGTVTYTWQAGDTNYQGIYKGEFIVTYSDTKKQTFPIASELNIIFTPPTPTTLTYLGEVMDLIQATKNSAGNYAIFGLPVIAASAQAQVNYANRVIATYIDLTTASPKSIENARLAALNMACLRVLVIATGGFMLKGFDFRMGDVSIQKSSTRTMLISMIGMFKAEAERTFGLLFSEGGGSTSKEAELGFEAPYNTNQNGDYVIPRQYGGPMV